MKIESVNLEIMAKKDNIKSKASQSIPRQKTVEEKYVALTETEHILMRPGMWIGSVRFEEKEMFLYDTEDESMKLRFVEYVPGMLKLVDEIISNSCDEYRRPDNMGLTRLEVGLDCTRFIMYVEDNGGIPVVKHKEAGIYIPEFIFGRLRTSSNYNDDEDRSVIGTNGVGSALTNIFSKEFKVVTSDNKNQCTCEWFNNMSEHPEPIIEKAKKGSHSTYIEFTLDYDRFEKRPGIEWWPTFVEIVRKRCIDAAAANPGLEVTFVEDNKKETWKFNDFKEYITLYKDYVDLSNIIEYKDDYKKVYVIPDGNINIGFVNGAECSKGTHIKALHSFVNEQVSAHLLKKDKIEVTPRQIDGKYSMFCDLTVSNPTYGSQTKEDLTTPIDKFYKNEEIKFEVSQKFLDQVSKSEIVNIVKDWYAQKQAAEDQKTIRQLNRQAKAALKRPDKFIECNSKKKHERELWIFEGDSAKAGFRMGRNTQTQSAYLLRGVPKNCYGLTPSQIMKNECFSDLVSILGLQFGKENDPKELNYGKIVIASDADVDGDKIAALLLVFYNYWPELFEHNLVVRSVSPIIIATKGKQKQFFYSLDEFRKVQNKYKGWVLRYAKGLGGLNASEYRDMLQNPIFMTFKKDELSDSMLRRWFSKDNSDDRKNMLSA